MGRLGALAAVLLIAGCGGDDGGSAADDRKEIEAVISKALKTDDPQVKCVDTVTKSFVSTIYRTLAACKAEEAKPEATKPPKATKLSAVKIDGDTATATVALVGGDSDGTSGQISFAKEDGAWKVDGVSVAFLRSQAERNLSHDRGDALGDAKSRACVSKGLARLGDDEFRDVAYDGIAGRDNQTLISIVTPCLAGNGNGGTSLLRKQFESGIRESAAKDGTPQKAVECVLQALRKSITDAEIIQLSSNRKELTKRVATAMINCDATG
jgi:hypothetical protein